MPIHRAEQGEGKHKEQTDAADRGGQKQTAEIQAATDTQSNSRSWGRGQGSSRAESRAESRAGAKEDRPRRGQTKKSEDRSKLEAR
jgi:hypothetical protein